MRSHKGDELFTLEHSSVLYKFLRGTWDKQYRIDTDYVVSSDRKTYRIGPNEALHIQYLMDGRGGLTLGKPHKGQVQITKVYSTLFPETTPKRMDSGVKRGKYGPRNPRFPSTKSVKRAEKKAATAAEAIMKSDGIPPPILNEMSESEYNRKAREAMIARMTCNTPKAATKKGKGKK